MIHELLDYIWFIIRLRVEICRIWSVRKASAYIYNVVSEQVKKLLNEGMDVNVTAWGPKSKGVTPLHLAAEGGHLGVMDELLERGANIDARTKGACGCKFLCFPCRLQY